MIEGAIRSLFIEAPNADDFFSKKQFSTLKYPEELIERSKRLRSLEELSGGDELAVEEVFDLLSDDGFRFLCPLILLAYQKGVFKFDGNLAEKFKETIWSENFSNDRKFGRGRRAYMFSKYRASLPAEKNQTLSVILEHLEDQ